MDYGKLIRTAWRMAWRHHFLWLLALFAGGMGMGSFGGGNNGGIRWQTNAEELRRIGPDVAQGGEVFGRWGTENPGIIVGLVALFIAFGIVLLIVALICQGATARATADLAVGQPTTLGQAWDAGVHLFGRYLGLWLLLIAVAFVVALVVGIVLVLLFAPLGMGGGPNWLMATLAVVLMVPGMLMLAAAAVCFSIVVAYAQRAIAVENVGSFTALQAGWATFRGHAADSLLTWLLTVALGIGSGIAVGTIMVGVVGLLGGIGLGIWAVAGLTGVTIVSVVVGGLATLVVGLTLVGLSNAFFWSYWTLAYLHLTGRIATLQPQPRPSAALQPGPA